MSTPNEQSDLDFKHVLGLELAIRELQAIGFDSESSAQYRLAELLSEALGKTANPTEGTPAIQPAECVKEATDEPNALSLDQFIEQLLEVRAKVGGQIPVAVTFAPFGDGEQQVMTSDQIQVLPISRYTNHDIPAQEYLAIGPA